LVGEISPTDRQVTASKDEAGPGRGGLDGSGGCLLYDYGAGNTFLLPRVVELGRISAGARAAYVEQPGRNFPPKMDNAKPMHGIGPLFRMRT